MPSKFIKVICIIKPQVHHSERRSVICDCLVFRCVSSRSLQRTSFPSTARSHTTQHRRHRQMTFHGGKRSILLTTNQSCVTFNVTLCITLPEALLLMATPTNEETTLGNKVAAVAAAAAAVGRSETATLHATPRCRRSEAPVGAPTAAADRCHPAIT